MCPLIQKHFKVTIVSTDFAGRHNVGRHQMIYKLVAEELAGPVHALSLHTYTPDEWQRRNAIAPIRLTVWAQVKRIIN